MTFKFNTTEWQDIIEPFERYTHGIRSYFKEKETRPSDLATMIKFIICAILKLTSQNNSWGSLSKPISSVTSQSKISHYHAVT